jgi:hypothetical protein
LLGVTSENQSALEGTAQRKITKYLPFELNLSYFIFNFKGILLSKNRKKGFNGLSQKMWPIHIKGAPTTKTDSSN